MNKLFTIVMLTLMANHSFSQTQVSQLFTSGMYQDCITLCEELLKTDSNDATTNYFKGASHVWLKEYKAGAEFLQKARDYNYQPAIAVNANLLRAYAGLKQTDALLELLEQMANQGFRGASFLARNPEFAYLADNQKYVQLKTKVNENTFPCLYKKEHKRLDFWVGDWDVMVNGSKYADSYITKSVSECLLYEDYRTLRGFVGQSTNYFDSADSLFKQLWIDGSNNITIFQEVEAGEGYLRMVATNGTSRMTWKYDSEKDEVLQTAESTSDSGRTWTAGFIDPICKQSLQKDPL